MNAYGCLPPKVDLRNYRICSPGEQASMSYPEEFTLEHTKVKNQGAVNSCVAHATSSILEYHEKEQQKLSTDFIYGIRKQLFDSEGYGMYLIDACKIAQKYGDMLESDCSGNHEVPVAYTNAENAFKIENKLTSAYQYRIDSYYLCVTKNDIKYAIMNYGPVLAALKWYDDYSLSKEQIKFNTSSSFGYHATMIYGWNKSGWLIQNSWGTGFGEEGVFILPYDQDNLIIEARAFVDHPDEDDPALIKPDINPVKDIFYKAINCIVNFFIEIFKKLYKQ